MSVLATRHLDDASAALPAAERALLNLWVHRGLEDRELAEMTGMTIETIELRRARIVAALSDELGLPSSQLESELSAMATASRTHSARPHQPLSSAAGERVHSAGQRRPRRGHRRWPALMVGVVALVVILAVILGAGSSGGGRKSRGGTETRRAQTLRVTQTLLPLPGGVAGVHGSASLTGKPGDFSVVLRVLGLPAASRGHYEAWLYDSILDSVPLGRVVNGARNVGFRLPADAGRFRFIDVSFQPPGVSNHSGESVLRAPNPAAR